MSEKVLCGFKIISVCPLLLTLNLLVHGLVPGRTRSNGVHQTSRLLVERGQSAQMDCSHDDGRYFQMSWYQQLPGESITLIVHTVPYNSQHDFGNFSEDKFSATKTEAERGSFTVKNVEPGDNGVYFCAVSTPTVMQRVVNVAQKSQTRLSQAFCLVLSNVNEPLEAGSLTGKEPC